MCGSSRAPEASGSPSEWITGHHIVPRRQKGGNLADNIVPLCWRCHRVIDSPKHVNFHERERARMILRANFTADEILYCRRTKGRDWLNHHYPLAEHG